MHFTPLLALSRLCRAALALGLWMAATSASAQDCPPQPQAPSASQVQTYLKAARDRGFLWRIEKDGRRSFLYGTVHVGQPEWSFPGPRLTEALRASSVMALELDMLDPNIMQGMQAGLSAAPRRELPEAMVQRIKAQMKLVCLPEQVFGTMSPEMLVTTLVLLSARKDGLDAAWGIDVVYAGLARGMKRPVVSLETPELQLGLLQGSTAEETQSLVEDSLQELEGTRLRTMIRRLAQDWADSRFDDLSLYEQWCECLDTPAQKEMFRRMLDERNPAMADKIAALHDEGRSVFAAVGSLHMIGPMGLPALLARRGYKVERIQFKP